ncbi:branched-chain amino acid ABC transporter permease [Rhizobium ruizarguesonis]|uniref:branched-chain amino acid ABC transporter permease n=1 Tax=Rhizobium ruizarguesonis TaxID=2081791 RepID=UPI0010300E79|nr:branched-chain amino acid ABC transporter permease [Rhizobium ruizarguesonis]NEI06778.1 branched-chain amino acid ABC transporter permease [Rhizobium ruizarguesonis]TAT82285.1 branched-chain amino acid ABC transporter permease [Rhizobium ruizarguesonis]TAU29892.1 branched-chain amino acid ABC transporter permease [Rhizobium ruizarguesonis]TAW20040.1 branched-chain amino acid ABC transporter permease [Rhizobium ruizarguesonis]TBA46396.1 branched-chain amino acid ABC transporter permease [Rhi
MTFVLTAGLEVLAGISSLVLIALGLAIVFGMMRVINLAHGEFLMLGAYTAITAVNRGVNFYIAILFIAPLAVGLIGLIVERLVIRHLYGRIVDTMLATWGLSLLFVGLTTTVFGNTTTGISSPIGAVTIGNANVSGYKFFIIGVAVVTIVLVMLLLRKTEFGLIARATMQNPTMAAAVGVDPKRTYAVTFALGAALAGLAGGVMAPITGIVPGIGTTFVAKAFITVIGGGASVMVGTLTASTIFGTVNQVASFLTTPVLGEVAMLLTAVLLLRLMPQGITGRFFRGSI